MLQTNPWFSSLATWLGSVGPFKFADTMCVYRQELGSRSGEFEATRMGSRERGHEDVLHMCADAKTYGVMMCACSEVGWHTVEEVCMLTRCALYDGRIVRR